MREEEEAVEVDTEDEQSSRWEEEETDNRLDDTFTLVALKFDDINSLLFPKITKSMIYDVF